MHGRRSFFKRLAAFVAVVALAPEIAFGSKLRLSDVPELDLEEMLSNLYAIAKSRSGEPQEIMIWTDALGAEVWEREYPKAMIRYYESTKPIVGVYEQLRRAS